MVWLHRGGFKRVVTVRGWPRIVSASTESAWPLTCRKNWSRSRSSQLDRRAHSAHTPPRRPGRQGRVRNSPWSRSRIRSQSIEQAGPLPEDRAPLRLLHPGAAPRIAQAPACSASSRLRRSRRRTVVTEPGLEQVGHEDSGARCSTPTSGLRGGRSGPGAPAVPATGCGSPNW